MFVSLVKYLVYIYILKYKVKVSINWLGYFFKNYKVG